MRKKKRYKWNIFTNGMAEDVMLLVHHGYVMFWGTLTAMLIMIHIDP